MGPAEPTGWVVSECARRCLRNAGRGDGDRVRLADALHSLANSTLKRARLGRISPFIDVEDVGRERLW